MHPREGEYESVSKRHDTTKYESLRCCWLQLARSVVDDDAEVEADSDADASAAVQFCVLEAACTVCAYACASCKICIAYFFLQCLLKLEYHTLLHLFVCVCVCLCV